MISKTVRFTVVTSPAAAVAPLLSRTEEPAASALVAAGAAGAASGAAPEHPRVTVSLSGQSIAVFNVHDIKRVSVWASHPKTVFAASPVLHAPKQMLFVPIKQHIELPRQASLKTIWAWPCASDSTKRQELRMDHPIFALFAPTRLANRLVVVHSTGKVSLVTHDLADTATFDLAVGTSSADTDADSAASPAATVVFAHPLAIADVEHLLLVLQIAGQRAPHLVVVKVLDDGNEPNLEVVHAQDLPTLTADSAPASAAAAAKPDWLHISFHAVTRHLAVLCPTRVVSHVLTVASASAIEVSTSAVAIPAAYQPLRVTALPNRYVAVLHCLRDGAPAADKSVFGVGVYDAQFGTAQGTTTFDADLLQHLANGAGKIPTSASAVLPDLLAVDNHLLASLAVSASGKRSSTSKAVILRSEVTFPPVTLLSVLGRARAAEPASAKAAAAAATATTTSMVRVALPTTDNVGEWKSAVATTQTTETAALAAVQSAKSAAALERALTEYTKRRAGQPVSYAVAKAVTHKLFSARNLFSRRAFEHLLTHSAVRDAACAHPGGVLGALAALDAIPAATFESVLARAVDITEEHLVAFLLRLVRALSGDPPAASFLAPAEATPATVRRLFLRALAYPHTDVFAHAALASVSAEDAMVLVQVLSDLVRDGEAAVAVPWLNAVLDTHLTTLLLTTPEAAAVLAGQMAGLLGALEPHVDALEAEEDTLGTLEWFRMQARRAAERRAVDKYVGLDGKMRERREIAQRERYAVEVLHL
ncbi:hypothetical protein H9P43_000657 [Blastocladiella emersonii ATCC 22665]|nr:hypothetical protein H9P43_000657 [Blastocladiella emersonii ATCC 22665]